VTQKYGLPAGQYDQQPVDFEGEMTTALFPHAFHFSQEVNKYSLSVSSQMKSQQGRAVALFPMFR